MRTLILWLVPLILCLLCWQQNPFRKTLVTQSFSIQPLSSTQRTNLEVAAKALNGVVLRPGGVFSFNRTVGPRTRARGYQAAPSYLGGESPSTLGGGICLLSSGLYQVALISGLEVMERVPHLRPIHTIPPGLDATVWYGQADLRLRNTLQIPVQLQTHLDSQNLSLTLKGSSEQPPASIRRQIARRTSHQLQVLVYRLMEGKEILVSRDLYRLSP
jgi:vancomycin resistance protein VanW